MFLIRGKYNERTEWWNPSKDTQGGCVYRYRLISAIQGCLAPRILYRYTRGWNGGTSQSFGFWGDDGDCAYRWRWWWRSDRLAYPLILDQRYDLSKIELGAVCESESEWMSGYMLQDWTDDPRLGFSIVIEGWWWYRWTVLVTRCPVQAQLDLYR